MDSGARGGDAWEKKVAGGQRAVRSGAWVMRSQAGKGKPLPYPCDTLNADRRVRLRRWLWDEFENAGRWQ